MGEGLDGLIIKGSKWRRSFVSVCRGVMIKWLVYNGYDWDLVGRSLC